MKEEIVSLTRLRFWAAFYVFLFHFHIRWPLSENFFLKNILDQGAVGMTLFFMLSGFVLAYSYSDLNYSFKNYLINRVARIYPIYFIAALVTLPWLDIAANETSARTDALYLGQLAFIVITNIVLLQAWFPQLFQYWNNGASWSISVEATCYVLVPLVLPRLQKTSTKHLLICVFFLWGLATLASTYVSLFRSPSNNFFYSLPVFRLPEFLIGIFSFFLAKQRFMHRVNKSTPVFLVVIFCVYLGLFGSMLPLYIGHNWIIIPIISLLLITLFHLSSFHSLFFSNKIFLQLGKISYCFYSFQALVILLLISHHDTLVKSMPFLKNSKIMLVCSFSLLIFLSYLAYMLIEVPARRAIRNFAKK